MEIRKLLSSPHLTFPLYFLPVLLANGDSKDGVGGVDPAVSHPEDQWWVELISPGDLSLMKNISASL